MSAVDELVDDIQRDFKRVKDEIDGIEKKDPSIREKTFNRCGARLVNLKNQLETYDVEISSLNTDEREKNRKLFREFTERLNALNKELENKQKSRIDKDADLKLIDKMNNNPTELTGKKASPLIYSQARKSLK